ncbi:MAG TPA: type II secretion system protein [Gemmatimonadaceae bacterium]|jgi:prepilin-type N-terminal cleavage/methylation domain-containing protein|nr:type II secretion system protein [Gemmatimonadaceae bacterium]
MRTRTGDAAVEQRTYSRKRSGFTILELLVVFTIAGVLIAITGKGLASAFAGNSRTSAVRVAGTTLFQARAIAIQRSRQSWLVRSGNTLKILADSLGTQVQVGKTVDLSQRYGVTLGSVSVPPGNDIVSFDPRGLITGTVTAYKLTVTRGTKVDTLCVTGLGNTRSRGC